MTDIEVELQKNFGPGPDDVIHIYLSDIADTHSFVLDRQEALWLIDVIKHKLENDEYSKSLYQIPVAKRGPQKFGG